MVPEFTVDVSERVLCTDDDKPFLLRHAPPRSVEDYCTFTSRTLTSPCCIAIMWAPKSIPRSTMRRRKSSVDWRALALGHSAAERVEAHGVHNCLPEGLAES